MYVLVGEPHNKMSLENALAFAGKVEHRCIPHRRSNQGRGLFRNTAKLFIIAANLNRSRCPTSDGPSVWSVLTAKVYTAGNPMQEHSTCWSGQVSRTELWGGGVNIIITVHVFKVQKLAKPTICHFIIHISVESYEEMMGIINKKVRMRGSRRGVSDS